MSSRTAERAKAVRKAWEREQQLVSSGEGTRDWTPAQQQSILDIGVALDDDGKPFEGQHMKSVAAYPEYAGDPNNIQFLTRQEHLEAHDGNWQNQTNWYYDPISKEKHVFGDGLTPCEIIALSDPISPHIAENTTSEETVDSTEEADGHGTPERSSESFPLSGKDNTQANSSSHDAPPQPSADTKPTTPTVKKSFRKRLSNMKRTVKNFSENHPRITGALKFAGSLGITAAASYVLSKATSGESISSQSSNDYDSDGNDYSTDDNSDYSPSSDDSDALPHDTILSDERNYPEERSSPREHIVPGHGQRYHTKDGVIWKEKDPYSRGGNKGE